MGLIILIVTGALMGWIASIALRIEDGRGILHNAVAGILGSVGIGVAVAGGSILASVYASTLLWATLSSIALIALYNLVLRNRIKA